jgi:hypothetical protein
VKSNITRAAGCGSSSDSLEAIDGANDEGACDCAEDEAVAWREMRGLNETRGVV